MAYITTTLDKDDQGNRCEGVYRKASQVLLSDYSTGLAWLEPADFYEDPIPEAAHWHKRPLDNLFWRFGTTVH